MRKLSVLPAGMVLRGEISGDEDLVVFGIVEGNVQIDGGLTIEESGTIRGDVAAGHVTVRGVLVGNATAAESVLVDAGARVLGDAIAPRVRVIEGARLRGKVHMGAQEDRRERAAATAARPPEMKRAETRAAEHAGSADDTLPGAGPAAAPKPVLPSLRRIHAKRKHVVA